MGQRVGLKTAGQLISDLTAFLKDYNQQVIQPDDWIERINDKIAYIHGLLGTKDRAVYKDSAILQPGDLKGGVSVITTNKTIYTDATRTLDLDSETMFSGAEADYIGAKVMIMYVYLNAKQMRENEVESVIDFATKKFKLKKAIGSDLARFNQGTYYVMIGSNNTADDVTIGGETWYKYIDQILSVYAAGIENECVDARTLSNFFGMRKVQMGYNYKNSVIYVRDGEILRFAKGVNVADYGERTIHYTRKPYLVGTEADLIDLTLENTDLLKKLLLLDAVQTLKIPIPQDLQLAETRVQALVKAKEAEIAKYLSNASDN